MTPTLMDISSAHGRLESNGHKRTAETEAFAEAIAKGQAVRFDGMTQADFSRMQSKFFVFARTRGKRLRTRKLASNAWAFWAEATHPTPPR